MRSGLIPHDGSCIRKRQKVQRWNVKIAKLDGWEVPYFCWDRNLTVDQIRSQLRSAVGSDWVRLASWILREAAPADVWAFLTPADVNKRWNELAPFLYRRKEFWEYLLGAWRELGRV